jgi:hypothetical protein
LKEKIEGDIESLFVSLGLNSPHERLLGWFHLHLQTARGVEKGINQASSSLSRRRRRGGGSQQLLVVVAVETNVEKKRLRSRLHLIEISNIKDLEAIVTVITTSN